MNKIEIAKTSGSGVDKRFAISLEVGVLCEFGKQGVT